MIRLNLFMIWFLHFLSLLSVICRYFHRNSLSRINAVLVYTVSTFFFDQCLNTTFRIWLSDIRFAAAKKMMIANPDYSNDIISSECGFTSRTHLYRIFKAREACTPTVWRERYLAGAHDSDASLS